jgi:hypothetical protein
MQLYRYREWLARPQIIKWAIILMILMIADVVISAGVLNGTTENIQEANVFAKSIGIWWIGLWKLLFVVMMFVWSSIRNSTKALKLCCVIMGGVMLWNVAMVVIYGIK